VYCGCQQWIVDGVSGDYVRRRRRDAGKIEPRKPGDTNSSVPAGVARTAESRSGKHNRRVLMGDISASIKEYLKNEFEMDDEDVQEMMDVFVESMDEMLDEAKKQLEASDAAGLGETGHAIKGAAANVGATNISELGKAMETAGKAGDAAACAKPIADLEKILADL
jgi:HPt (histidine-containing phosphotransfer) domain-containing protein